MSMIMLPRKGMPIAMSASASAATIPEAAIEPMIIFLGASDIKILASLYLCKSCLIDGCLVRVV